MSRTRKIIRIAIVVLLISVLLLTLLIYIFPDSKDFLPLILSFIATVVALASNFKNEIFPFQLQVLVNETLLIKHQGSVSGDNLILTIVVLNTGYADGIIESFLLKITSERGKKLFFANQELDENLFLRLLQGNCLNGEEFSNQGLQTQISIPPLYSNFPLHSKQSVKRHLVFTSGDTSSSSFWKDDTYTFELYAKISQKKNFDKVAYFKHKIDNEMLSECQKQGSYHLRTLLPADLIEKVKSI